MTLIYPQISTTGAHYTPAFLSARGNLHSLTFKCGTVSQILTKIPVSLTEQSAIKTNDPLIQQRMNLLLHSSSFPKIARSLARGVGKLLINIYSSAKVVRMPCPSLSSHQPSWIPVPSAQSSPGRHRLQSHHDFLRIRDMLNLFQPANYFNNDLVAFAWGFSQYL